MCGIYGMVAAAGADLRHPDAAERMAAALRHRGPDGHGRRRWPNVLIGVTRLRVIDLDPRADQPFTAPGDDLAVACNGEIYNAPELRRRYPEFPYRSSSDVEVILPLYRDRGIAGLRDLEGMFALAIVDRRRGSVVLARDRAGEKPLFLARVGAEVWFASEMGALLRCDQVSRTLDVPGLQALLRHGWIPEPRTPVAGITKVPAGTILELRDGRVDRTTYWDPGSPGPTRSADDIRALLQAAVARQTRADVPIGVFTSGGLDSSLIATLAAETAGAQRVRTFAVGFPDRSYDERPWAARLARHLGTAHAEITTRDEDVLPALDALAATGEPVADPAAVPTWCLARAARRDVTVVLSGEGADELFGGYPTYVGHRLVPGWRALPGPVRRAARALVARLPVSGRRVPLEFLLKRFVAAADAPWDERHLAWFANGLPADALGGGAWRDARRAPGAPRDVVAAAMRLDYEGPLRERLLVKVDRATMAVSLEARAPFLDPAVTRAAIGAADTHVRGIRAKRLLREAARPLLPAFILRRRKRGLSVPLGRWLNGPLADAAGTLLAPGRLAAAGIVDAAAVARLHREHRAGQADHGRALWTLFVVQHWMRHWHLETER